MIDPTKNCPFYGVAFRPASVAPFVLIEQGGNQCGVIVTSFSPCQLELDGRAVDWRECALLASTRLDWTKKQ